MDVQVCFPGDEVPLQGKERGAGITSSGSQPAFATEAGVLRQTDSEAHVENWRKRYIPRAGDCVIGIVTFRNAEMYRVDIRSPSIAYLPTLAFNGASLRNRPILEVGSLVYARVQAAHPDLDTELTCMDLENKKSWSTNEIIYGELHGGLNFEVPLSATQRLMAADSYVLERLGRDFRFEVCIGQNGRVWLSAATHRETVLLLQAIKRSFGMTDVQVEAMIQKMIEMFS
mmetsp:Transcript_64452/g.153835  ORF Transcript_64452/g.153835 Transcript_64452/m.153835 type:complete len:229 (-) Transcript_64452:93-779(-)|eukprot:CAMPEP_0178426280 /NCGR_PEP_ID=MMETSP0689_2-20121128/29155_1 /TAXON_ID=160604 /ORGANISM="Amphidinium massartii, Strain CS-259" /LENGTH=228 /DNA_ID=CAMNT_0020047965 /DNA_START=23 /DNA_END=709 /DNA_ORIENTATION=+